MLYNWTCLVNVKLICGHVHWLVKSAYINDIDLI